MNRVVPVKMPVPVATKKVGGSAREIELKLLAAEADLPRVIALAGQCAVVVEEPETRRVRTIYYDTPDLRLAASGVALRLRQDGREWRLALKTAGAEPGADRAGVAVRREWERVLDNRHGGCDFTVLDRIGAGAMVPEALRGQVAPVFETVVERTRMVVSPVDGVLADGVLIEVAVDRGQVLAGNTAIPIADVELELLQGPVHRLFELALALHARIPLRIGTENKAELGLRLLTGRGPVAVPPPPGGLTRMMTVAEAFRHLMRGVAKHLLANVACVAATADSEGVRQMRAGLRRLRLILRLFAEGLPDTDRRAITKASRWVSRCLREVQGCDELLARLSNEPDGALGQKAALLRRDAGLSVSRSLRSRRFTHFMLMLARWVEDDSWRLDAQPTRRVWLDRPVTGVVTAWLDRLALRAGRAVAGRRAKTARIRRRLIHLRDTIDLTRGLFPAGLAQPATDAVNDGLAPLEQAAGLALATVALEKLMREVPGTRHTAAALCRRWATQGERLESEGRRRGKRVTRHLPAHWRDTVTDTVVAGQDLLPSR